MRTCFFFACILFSISVSAQTDSAFKASISPTYTGINTLTRADIERLPISNFMQLVQGAVPYIGNTSFIEDEYAFVVNGFTLINPNAINISQIESISFYPAGTDIARGSLNKKGTFVITAKPQKSEISLSTKTGVVIPGDIKLKNTPATVMLTGTDNGLFTLDEINYSHATKKSYLSNAFSFLKSEAPGYRQTISQYTNVTTINTVAERQRFRFSNFGGYQFNQFIKVDGGFFYTSQPGNNERHLNYANGIYSGKTNDQSELKTNYLSGHAMLTVQPFSNLTYQIVAEVNTSKNIRQSSGSETGPFSGEYYRRGNFRGRYNSYGVSNRIMWQAIRSSSIHLDFDLFTEERRYKNRETEDSVWGIVNQPTSVSMAGAEYGRNSVALNVNPLAHLSFKNIAFAEAGFNYDTYGNNQFGPSKHAKILPVLGLRIELSSILKSSFISTLELSGSYNKYITNFDRPDQLGVQYTSNTPVGFGPFTIIPNPGLYGKYPPMENWLASFAIGMNDNRFLLKAQYRKHVKQISSWTPLPYYSGGQAYAATIEPLTSKGLCFELKTAIVRKENKNWDIYAMVFHDKYQRKYPPGYFAPIPDEVIFLDAGKAPWRGSIKTSVNYNHFFLQASAFVNFDEYAIDENGDAKNDMSRYACNYLLAGYRFTLKNKAPRDLEINVQSSGLFASKGASFSKYIGAGVKVDF